MFYLTVFIPLMLLSWFASYTLRRKFRKYSETPLSSGMSGAEIAAHMLHDHGIRNVRITCVEGELTDHYNPANLTVNLSEEVFYGRNAAAAAVAAHECGHAVQHARAYSFLQFRSAMVPVLSFFSSYMQWILLGGVLLLSVSPIPLAIGVLLFALTTLFSFITLPVEFDASKRAMQWLEKSRIMNTRELSMGREALNWAASTYVIAALSSLALLMHYALMLFEDRR